ncbi:GNAT family N-acetyltransferase [Micromonospora echinofusca]|uniref:GNAT family N-acetyltransferase n=1 Tax=Micromonospora echinofusca TaxID=47858 RepID=UPI000CAE66E7|nr:GNAT family N-acetyltransferase [Micromonospora sp. MSM11]
MTLDRDIRAYHPDDWPAIARVHDAARLDELRCSVGVAAFRSLADTAEGEGLFDGEVWVAVRAGEVVGFVALADGEITWLYVDPSCYRQGHGRALLRHALAAAGDVPVETTVLAGNDGALALYLAEGFQLQETKTGRLAGNEEFPATGHILLRPAPV